MIGNVGLGIGLSFISNHLLNLAHSQWHNFQLAGRDCIHLLRQRHRGIL